MRFTEREGWRGWREARNLGQPLYGAGSVEAEGSVLVLRGWRRTWLGVAVEAETLLSLESVRNVARDGQVVHCQCRIGWRWRQVRVTLATEPEAAEFELRLPARRTPGFDAEWQALREFNHRVAAVGGRHWVTPALVVINVATFVLVLIVSRGLAPDAGTLLRYGANLGLLSATGEWWRLLACTFLHFNVLHLAVNVWALWGAGRLTEKLYGSRVYLAIYLAAGCIASLTSLAWNPGVMSAGASGSIFGVFGALLAYLLHGQTQVPRKIVRAFGLSVTLFVAFNLVSGALTIGIDNAAHVGGLLSGFALGWLLARPIEGEGHAAIEPSRAIAAVGLAVLCVSVGVVSTRVERPDTAGLRNFMAANDWYVAGETRNLHDWAVLAYQVQAGLISRAEFAAALKSNVLPFWESAQRRLADIGSKQADDALTYAAATLGFAAARRDWARAIVEAYGSSDPDAASRLPGLNRAADKAVAVIVWMQTRELYDRVPLGLRNRLLIWWHTGRARDAWQCVNGPPGIRHAVAATDNPADGPALRHAAGCQAQRKFTLGDYAGLDRDLRRYAADLEDLPDSGSRLEGAIGGLGDLFEAGPMDTQETLARLGHWRRAVPGSVYPVLAEAMLYSESAWTARGHGSANTVNGQNLAMFQNGVDLAAASLQDAKRRLPSNPVWYALSISNGVDGSSDLAELRTLFNSGVGQFPRYMPIYRAMLRALMPRWMGSEQDVAEFIDSASNRSGEPDVTYALLYAEYALLEGDNSDFAQSGRMNWRRVQAGFRRILSAAPDSDYLLNQYANLACLVDDHATYVSLQNRVERRPSPSAWSGFVSAAQCSRKFAEAADVADGAEQLAAGEYFDAGGNRMTEAAAVEVKAQVVAALAAAEPLRKAVDEYVQEHGRLPPDDLVQGSPGFASRAAEGAVVKMSYGAAIEMRLRGGPLDGHKFSWMPNYRDGRVIWFCAQETVPNEYLSAPCR